MKRTLFVLALSLALAVSVSASYKMYMVTGEVLVIDEKPVVKDGTAYFSQNGLTFSYDASKIDFERSEKEALAAAAVPQIDRFVTNSDLPQKPAKAAKRVDDESLDAIRKRSRLANEGELTPPPEPLVITEEGEEAPGPVAQPQGRGASEEGAGGPQAAQGDARAQVQQRLSALESDLARAEDSRNQVRGQIQDLQSRYDSSTSADEKNSLASQIDSTRDQLTDATNRVNEAAAQVRSTRDELNSIPVVVELPANK